MPTKAQAKPLPNRDEPLDVTSYATEEFQNFAPEQITETQESLRHGNVYGTFTMPPEWILSSKSYSLASVDLEKRIRHFLPSQLNQNAPEVKEAISTAVLNLSRFILLLRVGPAGMGRRRKGKPLDVTSVITCAYTGAPALFSCAIAKIHKNGLLKALPPLTSGLAHIANEDLSSLPPSVAADAKRHIRRLRYLGEKGLWSDVPGSQVPRKTTRMKAKAPIFSKSKEVEKYLPLPDDYLSEMGSKTQWIIYDLAPNVLEIAEKMKSLWADTQNRAEGDAKRRARIRGLTRILEAHHWKDSFGHTFDVPPFPIHLPSNGHMEQNPAKTNNEFRWPPQNYRDMKGLLGTVQMAHLFNVALAAGPRASEILDLSPSCIVKNPDGRKYASGRTFKLVQSFDGEEREWLLPDSAAFAIEQQSRLLSLARNLTSQGTSEFSIKRNIKRPKPTLWAQISASPLSNSAEQLSNINAYLRRYAKTLGMSVTPGGQGISSHRFRKTLARLVALALMQAPKILMDVFGHKTIEMTLYYILTDKALRAEIETVKRELTVMRAKDAVEAMVAAHMNPAVEPGLGGYGGLGAVTLGSAVGSAVDQVHRNGREWGVENSFALAEFLTMNGTAWEHVRPGVLCTKLPGQAGICNKSLGRPEPANCSSKCTMRLEEALLRDDVDGSIEDCVKYYLQAIAAGEPLMASHWRGQIRALVPRFPDLKEKWMANQTVQEAFGTGVV